jgi:aryl-alcohol dehydrogenase-like predicted oxidoreductase
MNNRTLGKTRLSVSEIGYGAWGIGNSGWQGAGDNESLRALHKERLVPQVVRARSETV